MMHYDVQAAVVLVISMILSMTIGLAVKGRVIIDVSMSRNLGIRMLTG